MKKYIVFGYTNINLHDNLNEPTSEERQNIYKEWENWQKDIGELLVSIGSPLHKGKVINSEGMVDEKASDLSGYMIIKANDFNHAIELLNKSPLFGKGHGQKYEMFECLM